MGPWIVGVGVVLALFGILVWSGGLDWFGRLPGDLRFEGERSRTYVPITSMILASVVLTLLVNLVRRFLP